MAPALAWTVPLLLLASPLLAGEGMFPPISRILDGFGPAAVQARAETDLRDGLARAKDVLWLRAELRSRDWTRRRAAAESAGRRGNVGAIAYLGGALLRLNEDPRVRVAAAMGLGRIGHPIGGRVLLKALQDPEVDVRFAAALALGAGFEGGASSLATALGADRSWWVRYAAAVSLGRAGKAFSVDALGRAATDDPSWQVRLQAARSLGEIRTARSAEALGAPLRDEDPGVRGAAAIALGEVGGEEAIGLLVATLRIESEPFQRHLLTVALRKALR